MWKFVSRKRCSMQINSFNLQNIFRICHTVLFVCCNCFSHPQSEYATENALHILYHVLPIVYHCKSFLRIDICVDLFSLHNGYIKMLANLLRVEINSWFKFASSFLAFRIPFFNHNINYVSLSFIKNFWNTIWIYMHTQCWTLPKIRSLQFDSTFWKE